MSMRIGLGLRLSRRQGLPSAPAAPVNVVAPVVSGESQVGSTLTVSNGSWTGSPSPTFTYQWRKAAVNIVGETANTYMTVSGDVGAAIDCVVTATNSEGSVSQASSNSVTVTTTAQAWSHYKQATISGAAPLGYPVELQVWAHALPISRFLLDSTPGSDVGASQGVAKSATHFFTSGTSTNVNIRTYNTSWVLQSDYSSAADNGGAHGQINGLYYDSAAGKLYAGANNFPTTPALGWIYEYDVDAAGALTFVAAHSVGAGHCEGAAKHNGDWWVIHHDLHEIHQYNSSWVLVQAHAIPTADPGTNRWQGIGWRGDVVYLNVHGTNAGPPRVDACYWDGTNFQPVITNLMPPKSDCEQGFVFDDDGVHVWWAERVGNSISNPGNVVKSIFTESTGVVLEGRAKADFSDVKITNADGTVVLAGEGTGWREFYVSGQMAWFHLVLDEAIVTTKDIRVYYGNPDAVWSDSSASVVDTLNDFEAGRDAFISNYGTGSASSAATDPLEGTNHLAVVANSSSGVYSSDDDFIPQGLIRLTGWFRRNPGQVAPGVWIARTVTGTTRRRAAIEFNSSAINLQPGTNLVLASNYLSDTQWHRFQFVYDYAGQTFGARVWNKGGALIGSQAITAKATDDVVRDYKDVLLFRDCYADRIFSSALVNPEPAIGAWGVEQPA